MMFLSLLSDPLYGGGMVCGGGPWVFLPMPLFLFFLVEATAEDTEVVNGLPPGGLLTLRME